MPEFEPRLARISVDVIERAVRLVQPRRVWLFGSQLTGRATRGSDVDFALEISPSAQRNWSRFVAETNEEVPALIHVDLVDLDACTPSLAAEIRATGRVIYEAADVASA